MVAVFWNCYAGGYGGRGLGLASLWGFAAGCLGAVGERSDRSCVPFETLAYRWGAFRVKK